MSEVELRPLCNSQCLKKCSGDGVGGGDCGGFGSGGEGDEIMEAAVRGHGGVMWCVAMMVVQMMVTKMVADLWWGGEGAAVRWRWRWWLEVGQKISPEMGEAPEKLERRGEDF
ncbi:hypothetical protein Tco_0091746 [Tanacetum coccineum]